MTYENLELTYELVKEENDEELRSDLEDRVNGADNTLKSI